MKISDAQIAAAASAAGIPAAQVPTAVAIAIAESGGDPSSHNSIPPDDSYGLWQINMLGSLGPERRQKFGLTSNEQLYDVATNARAMAALSSGGTNWRPWTTYTRGTYLLYMSRGQAAAGAPDPTGVTVTPVGSVSDTTQNLTNVLKMLQNPKFWLFVAMLWGGIALTFYGIMKMTGDNQLSGVTKGVLKAGVGLIPGGSTVVQGAKAVTNVVHKTASTTTTAAQNVTQGTSSAARGTVTGVMRKVGGSGKAIMRINRPA